MPVRIAFHRGQTRFLALVAVAVAIGVVGSLVRNSSRRSRLNDSIVDRQVSANAGFDVLPVIDLCVADDAPEAIWTRSLASRLTGAEEVLVEHGRADVITSDFAIEIDFPGKWHEGLGQALHYGSETHKRPLLALVSRKADLMPGSRFRQLAGEVDRVCQERGVKLVVLRSSCPNGVRR